MYVTIVKERKSGKVSNGSVMISSLGPEPTKQSNTRSGGTSNSEIVIHVEEQELLAVVPVTAFVPVEFGGRREHRDLCQRLTYNGAKRYMQIRSKE